MTDPYACTHESWEETAAGTAECTDCHLYLYREDVARLKARNRTLEERVAAVDPEALKAAQEAVQGAWDHAGQEKRAREVERCALCHHKRRFHGDATGAGSSPACVKCFEKYDNDGPYWGHDFQSQHDDAKEIGVEATNTAPTDKPRDRAVIYETADGRTWQLYIPADAAVMVARGGILVAHEESEAVRILSVRPLREDQRDVPEAQHEQQG